ncbi:helix-turn-helix transcriptional regulator [Lysobacter sp. FW306-1B-D06B]|uniref:helix-turn-helix transcriptional regulator n=1 Tax=Lysobacter sp. FW306-1B-D06B TaxID=3140250 RepID=UPI0031408E93
MRIGPAQGQWTRCVGASRLGSVEFHGQELSIWIQMRGSAWVEAKEGRFYLRAGDWIAFARDSAPLVQADAQGVCIGIAVSDEALKAMTRFGSFDLHVGLGQVPAAQARSIARAWYRAARHTEATAGATGYQARVRSLLLALEAMQGDDRSRIPQCPGASLARKRQVFERMQRARLFMEGNCDRIIRVSELAERTQFSMWYFSKVFHRLYGESPQAACANLRLRHAANLLSTTPMTIGEVAIASGFDNNCSFARSFRAHFGMTASDYRNSIAHSEQPTAQMCAPSRANHIAASRERVRYARETVAAHSGHKVS